MREYPIDMTIPHISPNLIDYQINPKAFINAHDFPNLDALIEEVKRIDSDQEAYEAMLNEPVFLDFDRDKKQKELISFLESIVSQEPHKALRRGKGQHLYIIQTYMCRDKSHRDLGSLFKYPKIARSINKLLSYRTLPRSMIRILKDKLYR
ncbi:hypothetical protein [Helicobacter didelphidarum]|uniref:hypothetical protein n=1 Tax=Helicobacter didelphidarum TaxID=2040648 RepID=UPI0015F1AD93|nr:hypothetical protein [Helicobacter didelphidarum]